MGFYIETPESNHMKARTISEKYDGFIATFEEAEAAMKSGMGVVVVVDNIVFEAAGFAFNMKEFEAFAKPDGRRKQFVVMDYEKAAELSGFKGTRLYEDYQGK